MRASDVVDYNILAVIIGMDENNKEIEIKVKKILIHKRLHALLQEIKRDHYEQMEKNERKQPEVIPGE